MKSPCEDCLVKMCCSEICPKKINHDALVKDALKYYQPTARSKSRRGHGYYPAILRYNNQYRTSITKKVESEMENSKIRERKRKFKEDY